MISQIQLSKLHRAVRFRKFKTNKKVVGKTIVIGRIWTLKTEFFVARCTVLCWVADLRPATSDPTSGHQTLLISTPHPGISQGYPSDITTSCLSCVKGFALLDKS